MDFIVNATPLKPLFYKGLGLFVFFEIFAVFSNKCNKMEFVSKKEMNHGGD